MSRKIIPTPGEGLQFIFDNIALVHVKESVATYNNLPIINNEENDLRITRDTDHMHVWSVESSSGLLTDWNDVGSISTVDWSVITNKPNSSVADIDDAVTKKHVQGTDQKLDDGGVNEVTVADAKDAVIKKHTQGTDQALDTGGVNQVTVVNVKSAVNLKHTRAHAIDSTNDHSSSVTANNLMDADINGLPDDSGLSVANTSDAIDKKHTQGTDTGTSSDDFAIGDGTDTTKTITVENGDGNKPQIRYNHTTNTWQISNNGVDFSDIAVA